MQKTCQRSVVMSFFATCGCLAICGMFLEQAQITPGKSIYFRPSIGIITPVITIVGAHLVSQKLIEGSRTYYSSLTNLYNLLKSYPIYTLFRTTHTGKNPQHLTII